MPNWHASRRGLAAAANYPAQSDCWSPPLGQRSAVPTPMPTYARLARHGGHKALARKAVLAAPGAPPKHRSRSRARFGPQANFARADPSAAGCCHPPILRWREVGVRDSARGWLMYLPKDAAPHRLREAGKARENRGEIVRALASGQVTRRELFNWGLFTAGLEARAQCLCPERLWPGSDQHPAQPAVRCAQVQPALAPARGAAAAAAHPQRRGRCRVWGGGQRAQRQAPLLPQRFQCLEGGKSRSAEQRQPVLQSTKRGPMEGRPHGEAFAHQRWDEFFPKVGYVLSLAELESGHGLHPVMPFQQPNSIWTYGIGRGVRGRAPPLLIKARYGEPLLVRVYNALKDPELPEYQGQDLNRGFGRCETQLHFHNAHNGAESDGAANVHHFPGTF